MDPEVAEPEPSTTALEEFTAAIPGWAWPLAATNLGIMVVSIAGALLLPAESVVREFWGVWQLVIGLAMVVVLHVACFVMTSSSDTDIGILDLVVSPLKAWLRTFARLPERLGMVMAASNGLMLAVCAVLIVGGIQWDRLWDWGIDAPTKTSLVEAIASAAGNGPSNEDGLDEAIVDFAGQAAMSDDSKPTTPTKPKPPAERKKADCLIIGFRLNDLQQVTEVLVAIDTSGRLLYGGKLATELEPEAKRAFTARLMRARTGAPLVKTGQVATWVKPKFPVRVSYTEQATNGRLLDMKWEELLPQIDLPW